MPLLINPFCKKRIMKNIQYIACCFFLLFATLNKASAQGNPSIQVSVSSTAVTTCDVVTYTISWHYTGNGQPLTIRITDLLDPHVQFLGVVPGPGFTSTIAGNLVSCTRTITTNTALSGTITITAKPALAGTYKHCSTTNTASNSINCSTSWCNGIRSSRTAW